MNRRDFGKLTAVAAIASIIGFNNRSNAQTNKDPQLEHDQYMAKYADLLGGEKLTIALLAFPGMFLQDIVGPLTVFEALLNRDIHIVWKNKEPISAGSLIKVTPTTTFEECPQKLDVLFVPGGMPGTTTIMEDKETLSFIAERGKTAKYITSVCTGSLILGAAGLLTGYKATSYWSTVDILKEFGAIPTHERIVTDRNRITGGGITAGLDFGLSLAAKLRNPTYAQAIQLYLEYDPHPPFNSGSPKTAAPDVKKFINGMFDPMVEQARSIAQKISKSARSND